MKRKKKNDDSFMNSPEFKSGFVALSHKIKSNTNEYQIIKIKDRYFRVRELG